MFSCDNKLEHLNVAISQAKITLLMFEHFDFVWIGKSLQAAASTPIVVCFSDRPSPEYKRPQHPNRVGTGYGFWV